MLGQRIGLGFGFEWDLFYMEWANNSSVLPCLSGIALPSAQRTELKEKIHQV